MKRPVFKKGSAGVDGDGREIQAEPEQSDDIFQELANELPESPPIEGGDEPHEDEAVPSSESAIDHEYVQRLESEVKENYDKYLRAVAELENFKKRAVRERSDLLKYSGEALARDLLEIADNFHLAFAQNVPDGNDEFLKGFRLIHDRLTAILEQHQIRGESAMGQLFDPTKHQALASVPTADQPPGTILEEFKRAYWLKDKLLRPAQVVVAIELPAEAPQAEEKTE